MTTFTYGDFVECHAPRNGTPFIGRIVEITKGEKTLVKLQWMYRPEDLPPLLCPSFREKNEIFFSAECDTNDIMTIRRKVRVNCFGSCRGTPDYILRMEYLPWQNKIEVLHRDRIYAIINKQEPWIYALEIKHGLLLLELI